MSRFGDAVDLDAVLAPPPVGEASLQVPKDWETWDSLYVEIRDGLDVLRSVAELLPGVNLPELPGGSLADLVVTPFSGDWNRVRAHGDACVTLGRGMDGLGRNLAAIPLDLAPHWVGATTVSFAGHHAGYALAAAAAGRVVAQGIWVFEGIARVSQRVGEAAIRLLTRLGQLLVKVVRQLRRRVLPLVGWLATARDLIVDGLGPVLDLVRDVIEVAECIRDLVALAEEVRAWVEVQVERLRVLTQLRSVLDLLPTLGQAVLGGRDSPALVPGLGVGEDAGWPSRPAVAP